SRGLGIAPRVNTEGESYVRERAASRNAIADYRPRDGNNCRYYIYVKEFPFGKGPAFCAGDP
ncbi:MAG: hypothetical protein WCB62_16305, partial [Pseudolabrys sp.]